MLSFFFNLNELNYVWFQIQQFACSKCFLFYTSSFRTHSQTKKVKKKEKRKIYVLLVKLWSKITAWKLGPVSLKGVFAKNERGYRLTAKNKRFWSLLILLLSVAFVDLFGIKLIFLRSELNVAIFRICIYSTFFGMSRF